VDACNPLLQAHPTWARDEHEGRGIPTSLTPVSGRLALPPSRSASRSAHLGWGTRRHSLVGLGTPPVSKRRHKCFASMKITQINMNAESAAFQTLNRADLYIFLYTKAVSSKEL
jgi:hypothetical protein